MSLKIEKITLTTILVIGLGIATAWGQTRIVSATGSDAGNDCTVPGNPCATIQRAIDVADPGDQINVTLGTYLIEQPIVVNKSVSIFGTDPKPTIRSVAGTMTTSSTETNAEAGFAEVGNQGTDNPNYPTNNEEVNAPGIFKIMAPDVIISSLRLEVDQDVGCMNGIYADVTDATINNLRLFTNDIIAIGNGDTDLLAFESYGIKLGLSGGIGNAQIDVGANKITTDFDLTAGTTTTGFGRGFRSIGGHGNIEDSEIAGVFSIQWGDAQGGNVIIEQNTELIGTVELNISDAGNHEIAENVLTAAPIGANGFQIDSLAPDVFTLIELKDNSNPGSNVMIRDNNFINYFNIATLISRSANVTIDNNTFSPAASTANVDFIHLLFNTKVQTRALTDPYTAFFENQVVISNNTFEDNEITLPNNGTALYFADYNTIGMDSPFNVTVTNNSFESSLQEFVRLDPLAGSSDADAPAPWNNADYPINNLAPVSASIDLSNNLFDVGTGSKLPVDMTLNELFLVEDKIQHAIDYEQLGFVNIRNNEAFVTQNSFLTSFEGQNFTSGPLVQRAVDIASDGWTINIQNGSYPDNPILIQNDLTFVNNGTVNLNSINMNGLNKVLTIASNSFVIGNQILFNLGNIETGTNILDFNTTAQNPSQGEGGSLENANSRIIGRARMLGRDVPAEATLSFLGASILNATGGDALGVVEIIRTTGPAGITDIDGNVSIATRWEISTSSAGPFSGREIAFAWLPQVNNGRDTDRLTLFRLEGSNWVQQGDLFMAATTSPLISTPPMAMDEFSFSWTVSDEENPLPIQLLSFAGKRLDVSAVQLDWVTASELNNQGFLIQKSTDGLEYESLEFVSGAGTSGQRNAYQFVDSAAKGAFYYRLKQLDFDGRFTYSPIEYVAEGDQAPQLSIYPNPTQTQTITLEIEGIQQQEKVLLEVYNSGGQRVFAEKASLNHLNQLFNQKQSYWGRGNYLLQMSTSQGLYQQRFIKQ